MTMQLATNGQANGQRSAVLERVLALGDLRDLSPRERVQYYLHVCESVGLNPATKPFEYIQLNGKLTLYSTKNCTDQLRQIHNISVDKLTRETEDGVHIVTAHVSNAQGRRDEDVGAVNIANLKGEALANAKMKATTKAKRRATLSICGLSFLDESEIEAVKGAQRVTVTEDGEIIDTPPAKPASEPDLTQQLQASVSRVEWDKWAAGHLVMIEEAQDKGMLNEAWAAVNDDRRKLKDKGTPVPDLHYAALTKAKDLRKAALP
jgi:hypothetical protein